MSLRGRCVGVTVVLLAELGAALALGLGSASAEQRHRPSARRQITGRAPEPPLADGTAPPPPPRRAPPRRP